MLDDRLTGEPSTGHSRTLASLQRPQRGHSPSMSVGETGTAAAVPPAVAQPTATVERGGSDRLTVKVRAVVPALPSAAVANWR